MFAFDSLVFPAPRSSYTESNAPWRPEDVLWLRAEPKASQFPTVVIEPLNATRPERVILYCHGNACDIGEVYPSLRSEASRWRALLVLVEYPGYGLAPGRASREGVDAHLAAAYTHFTTKLGVPASRVVLFGCSVGTGPAAALAARCQAAGSPVGALILQSAYTSIRDAAAHLAGVAAYIFLAQSWDNAAVLSTLRCPVLLVHGCLDEVIPYRHSVQLAAIRAGSGLPVVFHSQEQAGHNAYRPREDLGDPVTAFLAQQHAQKDYLVLRQVRVEREKGPGARPPRSDGCRPSGCLT